MPKSRLAVYKIIGHDREIKNTTTAGIFIIWYCK